MRIAIIKCADCGEELNRTLPFPPEAEAKIRMTSALAAGPCPKGCRSTFTDMNINTRIEMLDLTCPICEGMDPECDWEKPLPEKEMTNGQKENKER
jgi:hypothetical protein